MLKCLYIENIAVIEKAEIEFQNGFNVLTGETGAGKSIIIDSLNAALGERTSKELIRKGSDRAVVTALFGNFNDDELKCINDNGFTVDENGDITIQRIISLSSGSAIKLNGQPITSNTLKDIAKTIVNIHGQHDNQSLLNPDYHYIYIDNIAKNFNEQKNYLNEFNNFNSIRKQITLLEIDEEEKIRKLDLLKYQINELENADITVGEYDKLKEKIKIAKDVNFKIKSLNHISALINGGNDSDDGLLSLTDNLKDLLIGLKMSEFNKSINDSENIYFEFSSVLDTVNDVIRKLNSDDFDISTLEERIELLSGLMLKYGSTEQKMLDYLNKCKEEIHKIEFSEAEIDRLAVELKDSEKRLVSYAEALTLSRKNAADKFQKEVSEVLKYLDMPYIEFKVKIEKSKYKKTGCDDIEFLISPNLGEDLKPLSKIASGGELSRIMLAIKSVLSDSDKTDTLIFDEIDTGISGYAAGKVAVQLKKVALKKQVLCITHLAQIAASADNHLLIEKQTSSDRTFTLVKRLNKEDKIKEIARIISGSDMTENVYAAAKELIENSKAI